MTNIQLIEDLIEDGFLRTSHIIDAFYRIDRKDFVPRESADEAYENHALQIGFEQTISQPLTIAFMLELLMPMPGEKILEIGAGSGYLTALLSCIVSGSANDDATPIPKRYKKVGKVIAIERIPQLKDRAEKNITKYSFIEKGIARVILGDGSKGYNEEAPFDKIIAGATAGGAVPVIWKEQLRVGGKIVAPVEETIEVLEKVAPNNFVMKEYKGFKFVPLVTDSGGGG